MKHGKKYIDSAKTIERTKLYEVDEGQILIDGIDIKKMIIE